MRIDIIHQRDPDSSCDVEVYVDGKPLAADTDFHYWSFDPGAGYDMDEFEESRREDVEAAPEFLKDTIADIYDQMKPVYEKWGF